MMQWERKRPAGLGGQRVARVFDTEHGMPKDIADALKKARRMGPGQCVDWADAALSSIGRNITDHRHQPGVGDHLRAAQHDAAALYACLTAAIQGLPATDPTVRVPGAEMGVASIRQG
jgi:hypothetical protein